MRKLILIAALAALFSHQVLAQQASSINPNVPATDADITSSGIRDLALAAYTDITALMNDHNLPSIGANEYLGTLSAGVAGPLAWPSCDAINQALIYTQGVGVRCNTLNFTGLGTVLSVGFTGDGVIFQTTPTTPVTSTGNVFPLLLTQQPNAFFAGPVSGVGLPSMRLIVGADLPAPNASTLGGVKSLANIAHQWINSISNTGQPSQTQPNFNDLAGNIAVSQMNGGLGATSTSSWCGNGTWCNLAGGITALTSDVTASGTGSVAATVNSFSNGKTIAGVAVAQTFTKAQSGAAVTITPSGGTYTPDFSQGNFFILNLVHASCPCTLANPINVTGITTGVFIINQSATGSDTLAYGNAYRFSNGVPIVVSTGANAVDDLSFTAVDSTHIQTASFGANFQ